jgi:transposase, IS30 family
MSYSHFTLGDRFCLATLISEDYSFDEIGEKIQKSRNSISYELRVNAHPGTGIYIPRTAHARARARRKQGKKKTKKITGNEQLRRYIITKMTSKYWSPEQIAGRLKEYPPRKLQGNTLCHETIYQWIYQEQPRLKRYLRCTKGKYRRRRGTKARETRREAEKKRRVDTRPAIVEKRSRIGDWEGDTIVGKEKTKRISTHVERMSGYLLADKLEEATAQVMREATINRFKRIPQKKRHTLTYDNGSENADYEWIEKATGATIYFCYPYHSWERGTNENTNGLLRQFFPKKSSFATITQQDVDRAVKLINNRPRKRLNYRVRQGRYSLVGSLCLLQGRM